MGSSVVIGAEGPTTPLAAIIAANFAAAAQDYLDRYPDIKAAYGQNNYEGAHLHFLTFGQNEGRTWNQSQTRVIWGSPGDKGVGGTGNGINCVRFPDGAKLGAINWQSAVKVGNSDILFALLAPGMNLINTFHHGEGNIVRSIDLPEPVDIPAGGVIWIWADGWGDASPGGIEVQTGLYFYGSPRWTN